MIQRNETVEQLNNVGIRNIFNEVHFSTGTKEKYFEREIFLMKCILALEQKRNIFKEEYF